MADENNDGQQGQPGTQGTPAGTGTPAPQPGSISLDPAKGQLPADQAGKPNPLVQPAGASLEAVPAESVESPFAPTGDAFIDGVVAGLHKAGIDVEKAAGALLESGKVDKAAQAALEKVYGKEAATAMVVGFERSLADQKAFREQATKTAHTFFGGEDGWGQAVQWAQGNLSQDVRDVINAGLAKGGDAMQVSLQLLKDRMEQAGQTVVGDLNTPGAPNNVGTQPIEFDAYVEAKRSAERRGDVEAVKALEARGRFSIGHYEKQGIRWQQTAAKKG